MIKGYSHKPMGTVALGTHLGNFSKEDSFEICRSNKVCSSKWDILY